MIVECHLFLAGTILLVILVLLCGRRARHRFEGLSLFGDDEIGLKKWDDLSLELGARIFSSEDFDFMESEASGEFQSRFREERVALALAWLVQLRGEVNRLMRMHAKVARLSPNLRPIEELKLAAEYCLFHLSNWILYSAVCVRGPVAAANLVAYSIRLACEVKGLTEVLPTAHSVAVELLKDDSERHSGSVVT
jgi:hypothetical protein